MGRTWALALAAALAGVLLNWAPPAHAGACDQASPPFTQSSGRIFQGNGARFIPHGYTVSGLERPDWADYAANDELQIRTSATAYCSNIVRLQVSEALWDRNATGFRSQVKSEVALGRSLGLAVVINDNAEWDAPAPHGPGMPTALTKRFWADMAGLYASDQGVIFDLFNEPFRAYGWNCWRNGGSACSRSGLVGFSPLAHYVRARAPNLIWIDGPGSLTSVKRWAIWGARPMMYSIHHPSGAHTAANWDAQFGWLATTRYAPVVDGEWTNWAARRAECWPDAASAVPRYLSYLKARGIGMTAWTLGKAGSLRVLTRPDIAQPSHIWASWACRNGLNESAGSLIAHWYAGL